MNTGSTDRGLRQAHEEIGRLTLEVNRLVIMNRDLWHERQEALDEIRVLRGVCDLPVEAAEDRPSADDLYRILREAARTQPLDNTEHVRRQWVLELHESLHDYMRAAHMIPDEPNQAHEQRGVER